MKHPGFTAKRTVFPKPLILCLAGACLLALLFLVQNARAADNSVTPDNLGSISGVVTNESGAPLANIEVDLYLKTGYYSSATKTDANGAYQLTLLPPGVYLLQLRDPDAHYAAQWYTHSLLRSKATDVVVAGNHVTGANVSLTLGGHMTGTVTVQQAGPATNGSASFYTQQDGQWQIVTSNYISSTGQYVSDALLPGVYRICAYFYAAGAGYYLTGCYGGPDVEHATDITLTSTETKTNLNMDVGEGEFNGVISGVVTADGAPRAGIKVSLYNNSYYYYGPTELVYVFTDGDGRYTIGGLADTKYRLGFSDPAGIYATTYYTHLQLLADSSSITLQEGQVISNINGVLTHAGTLQGNVHRYTGAPIPHTSVRLVLETENNFSFGWHLTDIYTETNAAGNYTFRGLWPGVYRVALQCYSDFYPETCTEFYGSKRDIFSAKDVVVQADQTTAGIDVTLGIENPVFMPIIQSP
jgi:hypothetical protein